MDTIDIDISKLNDLEIFWKVTEEKSIFYYLGKDTLLEDMNVSQDLKYDISVLYRKCALADIIHFILNSLEDNIKSDRSKQFIKIVAYIIIVSIFPKSRLRFSPDNNFRDVVALFKEDHGDQYIHENDLKKVPGGKSLIKSLIRYKCIKKIKDRYYILGHYLENLHIL